MEAADADVYDQLSLAVARFLRDWIAAPDEDRDRLRNTLDDWLREATRDLGDEDRGEIAAAFVPLSGVAVELPRSVDAVAVREAEIILRDANLEYLHEQFDTGGRPLELVVSPGPRRVRLVTEPVADSHRLHAQCEDGIVVREAHRDHPPGASGISVDAHGKGVISFGRGN